MAKRTMVDALAEQARRIREMEDYVPGLIKQARLTGASWTEIGIALGVSRQAAQKRWSYIDTELDAFGTTPVEL